VSIAGAKLSGVLARLSKRPKKPADHPPAIAPIARLTITGVAIWLSRSLIRLSIAETPLTSAMMGTIIKLNRRKPAIDNPTAQRSIVHSCKVISHAMVVRDSNSPIIG
jgi:hypothetical protein